MKGIKVKSKKQTDVIGSSMEDAAPQLYLALKKLLKASSIYAAGISYDENGIEICHFINAEMDAAAAKARAVLTKAIGE